MNKAVTNIWVQVSVCANSFAFFLLNKYLEVEWLDSMRGVCATVKDTAKVFCNFQWLDHFTFLPAKPNSSSCFKSLPAFGVIYFLIFAIIVSIKWEPIVVKVYTFLMNGEGEHLFMSLFTTQISYFMKCQFDSL